MGSFMDNVAYDSDEEEDDVLTYTEVLARANTSCSKEALPKIEHRAAALGLSSTSCSRYSTRGAAQSSPPFP